MNSIEELSDYIKEKLEGEYDYNTHVHAIADITLAAFNLAANKLGASGFSASIAELEFLQRSRRIDGPFALVKADSMLYPQYDLYKELDSLIEKWQTWAQEEAKNKLNQYEGSEDLVHPDVIAHWQRLAKYGKF